MFRFIVSFLFIKATRAGPEPREKRDTEIPIHSSDVNKPIDYEYFTRENKAIDYDFVTREEVIKNTFSQKDGTFSVTKIREMMKEDPNLTKNLTKMFTSCENCVIGACLYSQIKKEYQCHECFDGYKPTTQENSSVLCVAEAKSYNVIYALVGCVTLLFLLFVPYCLIRSYKAAESNDSNPEITEVHETPEEITREDVQAPVVLSAIKSNDQNTELNEKDGQDV